MKFAISVGNLMCPTTGISYQNPEQIYFSSTPKELVIIATARNCK
jgi:hypothetical protein